MPFQYRDRHDAQAIADHARTVRRRRGLAGVALFRSDRARGLPVCVVADDRVGLLEQISAAFVLSRLDVMNAEIYSRTRSDGSREAVDLFWVRQSGAPGDVVWIGPEEIAAFRAVLVVLLEGTFDRAALVQHVALSKSTSFGGTRLRMVYDAHGQIAGLDVETLDRPGLLFALSEALFNQRLQIVGSEVRTIGARAFDRFYFVERDGSAVMRHRRAGIEQAVLRALRPPHPSRADRELARFE